MNAPSSKKRFAFQAKILLPPLLMLEVVCIISSYVFGGSILWWLLLGWVFAAPLTILWALLLTRHPAPTSRDDATAQLVAKKAEFTSPHQVDP